MLAAALITLVILVLLIIFQIALIFGAPIGQFAWGGQHRILPHKLRVGSMLSLVIYAGIATIVTSKSGMYGIIPQGLLLDTLAWLIFVYLALGVILNAISRSKPERYTMTPAALVLSICLFVIASS